MKCKINNINSKNSNNNNKFKILMNNKLIKLIICNHNTPNHNKYILSNYNHKNYMSLARNVVAILYHKTINKTINNMNNNKYNKMYNNTKTNNTYRMNNKFNKNKIYLESNKENKIFQPHPYHNFIINILEDHTELIIMNHYLLVNLNIFGQIYNNVNQWY